MNKNQKSELISAIKNNLLNNGFVAVIHYRGMNDKQIYDLRVALRSKNCGMKVAKNTLVKIAIRGTELEVMSSYLNGPTAILYSQDPVALSKVISDFAKKAENLKIIVGYLDKSLIKEDVINSLAKLGSLEEVRASFIGRLNAVQSHFVRIINAPGEGIASSFNK
jgi:large subunit ribosomal protein L10